MKTLQNAVIGGFGSSVVALLYREGIKVGIDQGVETLPDQFKNLNANDVKLITQTKELLKKGSKNVEAVKAWQRLVNKLLGENVLDDDGDFGTNTVNATKRVQQELEKWLNINPGGSIIDKRNVAVGPEMKSILDFLTQEESSEARVELKKEVKANRQTPTTESVSNTETKKTIEKTRGTSVSKEVSVVIGETPKIMVKNLNRKERQAIVDLLPEATKRKILDSEPSEYAKTKGKDYFGGTDGQNQELFNYLATVNVGAVQTESHKGVQLTTKAAESIGSTDVTVVRQLRKTGRYQQIKSEFGIGKNTTLAESMRAAQDAQKKVRTASRSMAFEQDLRLTVQKAVDGGTFEGGVLGLVQAGIKKLSGKTSLQDGLNSLADKYGVDRSHLMKSYDSYTAKMGQMEQAMKTDPVGFLAQELGLDRPTIVERMKNDGSFLKQTRRFLARDILTGLLGAIPITHLKLNGTQKDVHSLLGYGQASEMMIRSNALKDMKKSAQAAEYSSAKVLNYLKGNNYSALRRPSSFNKRPTQTISQKEVAYVNQLRATAREIGIAISGADGKPGAISITVFDANLLRKSSYGLMERITGDAVDHQKVKNDIATLERSTASMPEKIKAMKRMGKLFKKEVNEDFTKGAFGVIRKEHKRNVNAAITDITKKMPQSEMTRLAKVYFKGDKYYSRKYSKTVRAYGIREGLVLQDAMNNDYNLFNRICSQYKVNSKKVHQLKPKYSKREGLMREFARSSQYTGTLLKAHNLHKNAADAVEKGSYGARALMGMLSRFATFKDLQDYKGIPITKDVESQLKKYYYPGKGKTSRTLALAEELGQSSAVRSWAKDVANYLNGNKEGLLKRQAQIAEKEARGLTSDSLKNIEKREKSKYAGDLDKILGKNPSKAVLAHYMQHTEVNGQMLSALYSNQIARLTGAQLTPSQILSAIAANAKRGTVIGHNTAFNTKIAGQNNYRGDAYTFTVPATEAYEMISGEGMAVKRMTEYTFAIKPGCTNLILLDNTGQQIEIRETVSDDHLIEEKKRLLIAVSPKWLKKNKPETPTKPGKLDTKLNAPEGGKTDLIPGQTTNVQDVGTPFY